MTQWNCATARSTSSIALHSLLLSPVPALCRTCWRPRRPGVARRRSWRCMRSIGTKSTGPCRRSWELRFVVGKLETAKLPTTPSVSCSCLDPLNTRSNDLPLSTSVQQRQSLSTTRVRNPCEFTPQPSRFKFDLFRSGVSVGPLLLRYVRCCTACQLCRLRPLSSV